jgi:uncharacterized membrane protein YjjP (DUF1212 family)
LAVALQAGEILLENGANTGRVEETVQRIGAALGVAGIEVYVTPTGIIASAAAHGEHQTQVLRVMGSGFDLSRVAAVLEVSRGVVAGRLDREAAGMALEKIAAQGRVYPQLTTALALSIGCASFAALFGGEIRAIGATAIAAGAAQLLRARLLRANLGRLLPVGIVAAFASGLGLALALVFGAPAPTLAMLSSVLLLVPGALMVSSISDLFRGDTIAGLARAAAAGLTISAVASGIWAVLLFTGIRISSAAAARPLLPLALLLAFTATIGFAVAFDVPRRTLLASALTGMLAYGAREAAARLGFTPEAAIFVAGIAVELQAELWARALKQPTSIFTIPGFIPLAPGTLAFRTVLDFVNGDYVAGTADFARTAILTFALAAGLGTVTALARMRRPRPGWVVL